MSSYRRKSNVGDWAALFDTLHQTYTNIKKLEVTRQLEELKYNAQIKENQLQRKHENDMLLDKHNHEMSLETAKTQNDKEEWLYQQIMDTRNAPYLVLKPNGDPDLQGTQAKMMEAAKIRQKGATFSNMSFLKAQSYYDMATTDVTPNAITQEDLQLADNYMSDVYFHPIGDYQYTNSAENEAYLRKIGILGDDETYSGADGGTPGAVVVGDDGVSRKVVERSHLQDRWREYKIGLKSNNRFMDAAKYQTHIKGGFDIDTSLGSYLFQTQYMTDQKKIVEAVPSTIMTSSGYFKQTIDKGKSTWDLSEAGLKWMEKNEDKIAKAKKKGELYEGDILYQLYHGGDLNHIFDKYIAGTMNAPKGIPQSELDDLFKDEWLINPDSNLLETNSAVYDALQAAFFARQSILGESQRQTDFINNMVDEKYRRESVDAAVAGRNAAGAKWKKVRLSVRDRFKQFESEIGSDWQSSDDGKKAYMALIKELITSTDIDPESIKSIVQAEKERYNK